MWTIILAVVNMAVILVIIIRLRQMDSYILKNTLYRVNKTNEDQKKMVNSLIK